MICDNRGWNRISMEEEAAWLEVYVHGAVMMSAILSEERPCISTVPFTTEISSPDKIFMTRVEGCGVV